MNNQTFICSRCQREVKLQEYDIESHLCYECLNDLIREAQEEQFVYFARMEEQEREDK